MHGGLAPEILTERFVARSVNTFIRRQGLGTRWGVKVLNVQGEKWEEFQELNVQGATAYNPANGLASRSFSRDESRILIVSGGRKWDFRIPIDHPLSAVVEMEEVPYIGAQAGVPHHQSNRDLHLAWVYQAENYVLSQDANGPTWFWDGVNPSRISKGLNENSKEGSMIANGASAGVYAHGRIVQAVNNRQVIVGDIIHKNNLTSSKNILGMTEQVYWATGSHFAPPSVMGEIRAMGILPLQDTTHGHGDVIVHCADGAFSLDVSQYPRENWTNLRLTKILPVESGALGPYAHAGVFGDHFFRSRAGVQSIRSAAANTERLGSPLEPVSEAVSTFLDADYEPYLKFCSMASWQRHRKLFTTTGMYAEGRSRGGKGFVSLNLLPTPGQDAPGWDGLQTLPKEIQNVHHIVKAVINSKERIFIIASGADGKTRLAEMVPELEYDILEDGGIQQIECQVISRIISGPDPYKVDQLTRGVVKFQNVTTPLCWEVYCRNGEDENWRLMDKGEEPGVNPGGFALSRQVGKSVTYGLGSPPKGKERATGFQFLVKWTGRADLVGLRGFILEGDPKETSTRHRHQKSYPKDLDYSDYSYHA